MGHELDRDHRIAGRAANQAGHALAPEPYDLAGPSPPEWSRRPSAGRQIVPRLVAADVKLERDGCHSPRHPRRRIGRWRAPARVPPAPPLPRRGQTPPRMSLIMSSEAEGSPSAPEVDQRDIPEAAEGVLTRRPVHGAEGLETLELRLTVRTNLAAVELAALVLVADDLVGRVCELGETLPWPSDGPCSGRG